MGKSTNTNKKAGKRTAIELEGNVSDDRTDSLTESKRTRTRSGCAKPLNYKKLNEGNFEDLKSPGKVMPEQKIRKVECKSNDARVVVKKYQTTNSKNKNANAMVCNSKLKGKMTY